MTLLQQYQEKIKIWDIYPDSTKPTIYLLGAYGELGELVDKVMLYIEKYGKIEPKQMDFALELGDIYWYLFRFLDALGFTYDEIIKIDVEIKKYDTINNLLKTYVQIGKISNKIKKVFRDHGEKKKKRQMHYAERLAKIFKYLEVFQKEIDFTFEEVIQYNYEKLDSRYKRGKIKGDDDNR